MTRRDPVWLGIMKLAFWVGGVLLFFRFTVHLIASLGGDIRELWVPFAGASTVFLALYTDLVKQLRFPDGAGSKSSALPVMLAEAGDENAIVTIENGATMSSDPNTGNRILHINNAPSYHNNAPGGIIGSGPITIHQHFDKSQPQSPAPDAQSVEPVSAVPAPNMANLDELLAYAESLWGKAVAENTVRNILERAEIESCGEEKRGRARPKLYPRELAEKAIADHISASNKKK